LGLIVTRLSHARETLVGESIQALHRSSACLVEGKELARAGAMTSGGSSAILCGQTKVANHGKQY
jgi:hypothetical protein